MKLAFFVIICLFSTSLNFAQHNFWVSTKGPVANSFTKFFCFDGKIFACTEGIFKTENNGKNWQEVKGEIENRNISKIDCDINGNLYADAFIGVYKSTDKGNTWKLLKNLKRYTRLIGILEDSIIFVMENGKQDKILYSVDGGKSFKPSSVKLSLSLTKSSYGIYISCNDSRRCIISTNKGKSWKIYSLNKNLSNPTINCAAVSSNGKIYLGNARGGVFCSSDTGKTWKSIGLNGYNIRALSLDENNTLFAGIDKPTITTWDTVYRGIFSYNNSNNSWSLSNLTDTYINDMLYIGNDSLLVSTYGRGIFILQTKLKSYKQLTPGFAYTNNNRLTIDRNDNIFLTTYFYSAFRSTDNGIQWKQLNYGLNDNYTEQIAVGYPSNIYIATWNGGIFYSDNLGDSWKPTQERPECITTSIVSRNDKILFVGTNSSGVFKSTNSGSSWQNCGLSGCKISDLIVLPDKQLLAGSYGITEYYAREIVETDSGRGVFYSLDDGSKWTSLGLKMQRISSLAVDSNNIIFAGSDSTLFISNDFGNKWRAVNLDTNYIYISTIYCDPSGIIFVGTEKHGIYYSTDIGNSWNPINNGLTSLKIRDIKANHKGDIFVATENKGVYRGQIQNLIK